MKHTIRETILTLALISATTLSALPFPARADSTALRMGGSHVLSVLPLLAQENGFFAKRALTVRFERIKIGKLAMDALLHGSVDFAIIVDTNIAINSFQKSDLRILAAILSNFDNGLAFRSSIHELNRAAVLGSRIAYVPGTTSHFFLLHLLEQFDLSWNAFRPIPLQPNSMLPALRSEAIDMASIWNPWRYEILQALPDKIKEITLHGSSYRPFAYLATTSDFLSSRPEAVAALILSLHDALLFAQQNPVKVRGDYARWNGMDEEATGSMWDTITLRLDLQDDALQAIASDIELLQKYDPGYHARSSLPLEHFIEHGPLARLLEQRK